MCFSNQTGTQQEHNEDTGPFDAIQRAYRPKFLGKFVIIIISLKFLMFCCSDIACVLIISGILLGVSVEFVELICGDTVELFSNCIILENGQG